jgi:hypothetical protein
VLLFVDSIDELDIAIAPPIESNIKILICSVFLIVLGFLMFYINKYASGYDGYLIVSQPSVIVIMLLG